jgi:hypothetical protein
MIREDIDELVEELRTSINAAAVGLDLDRVQRVATDAIDTAAWIRDAAAARGDDHEVETAGLLRDNAAKIAQLGFRRSPSSASEPRWPATVASA